MHTYSMNDSCDFALNLRDLSRKRGEAVTRDTRTNIFDDL